MRKEVIQVALAFTLTATALTAPIANVHLVQPIKAEAYTNIDKDRKPKEPVDYEGIYFRNGISTIERMASQLTVEKNIEENGTLTIRGSNIIINSGEDITSHIELVNKPSDYINRKQFYYKAGYVDTVENAREGKATSYLFTAPFDGQFRMRWVGNEESISYTGFDVFDCSTNKKLDPWDGSGKKMASKGGYGDYYSVDVKKGKKYRITFASLGGNLTNKFEMFFIKVMDNNSGKKIYDPNSWYTYSISPKYFELIENDSFSDDRRGDRELTIKVEVKTKSKVTLELRELSYAYEGWSYTIGDYGVYKKSTLDDYPGSKNDIFNEIRTGVIKFNKPLEIANETAKIEIVLDKGTYYFPVALNIKAWDFCFRYNVEPLTNYYTPTITEYKAGTSIISGTCLPNTKVYVNVDNNKYRVSGTGKADGTYAVSIKGLKLKKGMKIKVAVQDSKGVKSKATDVTVK